MNGKDKGWWWEIEMMKEWQSLVINNKIYNVIVGRNSRAGRGQKSVMKRNSEELGDQIIGKIMLAYNGTIKN